MSEPRDSNKPQHNLTDFHYGEITRKMLPAGTREGDFWYWDHANQEWATVTFDGGAGIVVDFDRDAGTLRLILASAINQYSFTASSVLLKTTSGSFAADSALLKTTSGTFTADAVLI